MRYILVILASCTALIYFLAAHQDAEELTNPDLNSQRLGTQVEYALFIIVGVGYASMSVWILVGKSNMTVPYSILISGSILLIGIYLLAITYGVSPVGVEDDSDILATVSKMLQASIISITAILICSARARKAIPKIIENHGKNCILCGRQIDNELSSVTLRMPDGTDHVFDSDLCMKYFQKLSGVYGNNLA